jgi:hypothetical protein
MSDLTKKAYPFKLTQEHKHEQEHNQNCVNYEVGSHKLMNDDIVQWQNKQNTNPNLAVAANKIEVMGVHNPWRHP